MAQVIWTPRALHDLDGARLRIEQSSQRAAARLIDRVDAAVQQLVRFPNSGRIVPEFGRPDLRELIVQRYRVVYRVLDDGVQIVRVQHGSRLLPPGDLPSEL